MDIQPGTFLAVKLGRVNQSYIDFVAYSLAIYYDGGRLHFSNLACNIFYHLTLVIRIFRVYTRGISTKVTP